VSTKHPPDPAATQAQQDKPDTHGNGTRGGTTTTKARLRRRLRALRETRELALLILVTAMFVGLSVANENFFTKGNLVPTAVGMSPILLVSVGMTLALISGLFDLSVGGIVALACVVIAYAINSGASPLVGVLAGVAAAWGIGLLNGLLVTKIGINPLVTTLGTLGISGGLALIISKGTTITPDPLLLEGWFNWFGNSETFGVPNLVFIVFGVVLVFDLLARRARVFRNLYLLGGSERAAKFIGMNVTGYQIAVFLGTATLSAAAGFLLLSRFGSATPEFGRGYELQAIAAAVIGGASLSGGSGSILGVFLATALLAMIQSALVLYEVSVYWQTFITGVILVVAVAVTLISDRGTLLKKD
jgi:ribose transport system permease protein